MGYNRCGKCMTGGLELTRLETEVPENQILHRIHSKTVTVYHLKSRLDGYESLVAVPKDGTIV